MNDKHSQDPQHGSRTTNIDNQREGVSASAASTGEPSPGRAVTLSDGSQLPERVLPIELGGRNGSIGQWARLPEDKKEREIADKVYRALVAFTNAGEHAVATSPADLARRLGLDTEAANQALYALRAAGLIASDRSENVRALDSPRLIVILPRARTATPDGIPDRTGKPEPDGVATPRNSNTVKLVLEETGRNTGSRQDRGRLPYRGEQQHRGNTGSGNTGLTPLRRFPPTTTRPPTGAEIARAQALAETMLEPDQVEHYLDVVLRFAPRAVDLAEASVLGTPDEQIRKSRGALFSWYVGRYGHEIAMDVIRRKRERGWKAEGQKSPTPPSTEASPAPSSAAPTSR